MLPDLPLPRGFYERPPEIVAPELLGMVLVNGAMRGRIVEVEAYLGQDDPAAHSSRGRTARTEVLFGPGGFAYVYLIYGIHHCLNVSCQPEGHPGCVLIRALDIVQGPARLTRAMGITRADNGRDLTKGSLRIVAGTAPSQTAVTPRIGIVKAKDLPLRFLVR